MNGQFSIGAVSPKNYFLFIGVFLGLLFGLVGQDDMLHQNRSESFVYLVNALVYFLSWQVNTLGVIALLLGVQLSLTRISWLKRLNPWSITFVSAILGSILFAPIGYSLDLLTGQEEFSGHWHQGVLQELSALLPLVILGWLAINAPWILGYRLEMKELQHEAPAVIPRFMQLIPQDRRGELIYIKSELHYLQVVTQQGSSLILYNLKDAVEELDDTAGITPHRSYWVAKEKIEKWIPNGRQARLRLANGDEIPVSRRNAASVRNAISKEENPSQSQGPSECSNADSTPRLEGSPEPRPRR